MKLRRSAGLPIIGMTIGLVLVLSGCDSSSSSPTAGTTRSTTSTAAATGGQTSAGSPRTSTGSPSEGSGHSTTKPTKGSEPEQTDASLTPTEPPASGVQDAILDSLPGSSDRNCVAVRHELNVRSGGVAIGNFTMARQQYADDNSGSEQPTVSLYVIPRHSKPMSGVRVTMKPMGRSGKTVAMTSHTAGTANSWHYYSVSLSVPSPGAWRLTAVSGPDRGCFDVTFKS